MTNWWPQEGVLELARMHETAAVAQRLLVCLQRPPKLVQQLVIMVKMLEFGHATNIVVGTLLDPHVSIIIVVHDV